MQHLHKLLELNGDQLWHFLRGEFAFFWYCLKLLIHGDDKKKEVLFDVKYYFKWITNSTSVVVLLPGI